MIPSLLDKIAEKSHWDMQIFTRNACLKRLNKIIKNTNNYDIVIENIDKICKTVRMVFDNCKETDYLNEAAENRCLKCVASMYFCDPEEMNNYWHHFTEN